MESLTDLQLALKETLAKEGIHVAINRLKERLPGNGPRYNDLILLTTRLREIERDQVRNLLAPEEAQRQFSRLRADLLQLIDELQESDFVPASDRRRGRQGRLLYQIPTTMQLYQETKCLVRLAFREEWLLKKLDLSDDTKIQSVRISEVMEIDLLDPNDAPAFGIRAVSSKEQFVEEEDYTEWLFYVKPLRVGRFPLLLKVTVIEQVKGQERQRDIVLEELVEVLAVISDAGAAPLKSAGCRLELGPAPNLTESGSGRRGEDPGRVVEEQKEDYTDTSSTRGQGPTWYRIVVTALAALFVIGGVSYAALPGFREAISWRYAKWQDDRKCYEQFIRAYPRSDRLPEARERLEDLQWQEVMRDTAIAPLQRFLAQYPDGEHSPEGRRLLEFQLWESAKTDSTGALLFDYLQRYPDGEHAKEAQGRLYALPSFQMPMNEGEPDSLAPIPGSVPLDTLQGSMPLSGPRFRDPRDGQIYPFVEVDGTVWMAANLNYQSAGSFCYVDDSTYCAQFGRLYTWEAAQRACPPGWNLATPADWDALIASFGGTETRQAELATFETLLWGGDSGLKLQLGGSRFATHHYWNMGDYGRYWTTGEYIYYNFDGSMGPGTGLISKHQGGAHLSEVGYSCRCVKGR